MSDPNDTNAPPASDADAHAALATEALGGLAEALDAIGDRWSPLVIAALLPGPARFGELQERLPAIAPNVLSARLRSLEGRGLLVAQPYSQRPPRFTYELAATGRELAGALRLLGDWGARHAGGDGAAAPVHGVCGTPLEIRWYCPTCAEVVPAPADGEAASELYYA